MERHTTPVHDTPPVEPGEQKTPVPQPLGFDTNEDKQIFDSLEVLRKATWERFDKRREFEWRVALALWAGMGTFGAFTIAKDTLLRGSNVVAFAVGMALTLTVAHFLFLNGLTKRNNIDRRMTFEFEDQMHKLTHWQFSEPTSEERKRLRSVKYNYSFCFQLLVTIVLATITVAALWWKSLQVDSLTRNG